MGLSARPARSPRPAFLQLLTWPGALPRGPLSSAHLFLRPFPHLHLCPGPSPQSHLSKAEQAPAFPSPPGHNPPSLSLRVSGKTARPLTGIKPGRVDSTALWRPLRAPPDSGLLCRETSRALARQSRHQGPTPRSSAQHPTRAEQQALPRVICPLPKLYPSGHTIK